MGASRMLIAGMQARVHALRELFAVIERTRMVGVPVLHPGLWVQAVGFEPLAELGDGPPIDALGILIVPWFMNLVRLPLERVDSSSQVGRAEPLVLGGRRFMFIGTHEPDLGAYSACSLFTPMFEFVDQAAALATALAVLDELRRRPMAGPSRQACAEAGPATSQRRTFMFGRSATGAPGR